MDVQWTDESKRVLWIERHPDDNWQIFADTVRKINALAKSVEHSVWILDAPDKIPLYEGDALAHLRHAYTTIPDNVVGGALVINHTLTRVMVRLALSLYNRRLQVKMCSTLDIAQTYINAQLEQIDDAT